MSLEDFRAAGFRDADEIERERNPPSAKATLRSSFIKELMREGEHLRIVYGFNSTRIARHIAGRISKHIAAEWVDDIGIGVDLDD